jgi:HSP20 family protein
MTTKCLINRNSAATPFPIAFSKVFDDFFPTVFGDTTRPIATARPSVDVIEQDDQILILADMPGMEKETVKVTVHNGNLAISGSRNEEPEVKTQSFSRSERYAGSFSRSFTLPTWADGSKIAADYTNGVLTVTIPKTEEAKPKAIDVQIA